MPVCAVALIARMALLDDQIDEFFAAQIFGKYRPIADPTINLRDVGSPMPGS